MNVLVDVVGQNYVVHLLKVLARKSAGTNVLKQLAMVVSATYLAVSLSCAFQAVSHTFLQGRSSEKDITCLVWCT